MKSQSINYRLSACRLHKDLDFELMTLFCQHECKSWALYEYTGKNMSDSRTRAFLEIYDNTVIFLNTSRAELEYFAVGSHRGVR